jgi:hypothetical protein
MANFEDFDVPDWARAAWSRPPKKGDILFRPASPEEGNSDGWQMNAVVGKADDYAYSEGYRLAGRIVADYVIQKPLYADFLVYPIVFLYRHYVELQLKRLIPMGARLVNQVMSEADHKTLREHPLDKLWALFEPILQKAAQGTVPMTPEGIEGLGWYVSELNKFDPGSFSGRYALDRQGVPYIDNRKHPAINIGVLAEGMERLTGYLFDLGEAFREERQAKCESEDEARAEDMECYDGE